MTENNKALRITLLVIRIVVGLLFIFSGLIKANDPLGLSYKTQEFFEVWGISSLNDYTLFLSIVLNTIEIVAGVAIILGWRTRFFIWLLLLLIIFFTFLTGYAFLSGKIKSCGCFGDCIPLTSRDSFVKDLILLVLILVLLRYRKMIVPFLPSATNGGIVVGTAILSIALQWWVLKHLPIVDCLPYKVGNDISEKMKIPAGARQDSFAIQFRYRKEGKIVEFDMNNFPDDFNDSTYEFVERNQKLVKEGTAKAAITDFGLNTLSGNDTTAAILSQQGHYVLFLLKDLVSAKKHWEDAVPKVLAACKKQNIPFYLVTSVPELAKAYVETIEAINSKQIIFLSADGTMIKTAARENPTYIIMKGSKIVGKYAEADVNGATRQINSLK